MDMFIYTSMFFTKIHVYHFIFHNELLFNNLIINNYYVIYVIIMN
jgi:hypothetical protein